MDMSWHCGDALPTRGRQHQLIVNVSFCKALTQDRYDGALWRSDMKLHYSVVLPPAGGSLL